MSADVSAALESRGLPQQPAAEGPPPEQTTPFFREACCLEVPIRVFGSRAIGGLSGDILKGEPFEEESVTMLLFPRGGVIRLAAPVAPGHDLMLIDLRTNRYVHCRITNVRTSPDVKSYVELEFTHGGSDFWGISPGRERGQAASAGAAGELPWARTDSHDREPGVPAPKALAAAAGVETTKRAFWAGYAVDSPSARPPDDPAIREEERENLSEAPFFVPQQTEALPVSEPVIEQEAEAAPPLPQAAKWEAVSKRTTKRKGRRRAAVGAVIASAIFFGYRITAPVATLPTAIESVSTTSVDVLPPGIAETAAAVKKELANKDWGYGSSTAAPVSAQAAVPPAAPVVAGTPVVTGAPFPRVPETKPVAPPKRLLVPAGKMILPVQNIVVEAHSAPEMSGAPAYAHGTATPQFPGAAPGENAGLLAGSSVAPPPPPEPAPAPPADAAKSSDEVTAARLLVSVPPDYPLLARQAHIEGDVLLEVQVDALGRVTGSRAVSGPQALRAAASSAVLKWKFAPARLRDQATASSTTVTLKFRLK